MTLWQTTITGALAAIVLVSSGGAIAQKPPSTVRLIVPFPPGGPVDFVGRVIADGMRAQSSSTVVVDNRAGANGALGIAALKQAPPDGTTLIVVSSGMITFSPHFERNLPYDAARDFTPVANAAFTDVAFVVANNVVANDLREFVALARASVKPLAMGSAGQGNITHAYLELFKDAARIDLLHVPYKGASPALADVMGGQIAGMFTGLSTALPGAKAGKSKILAVIGKRSQLAPQIPTITEQGVAGVELLPWFGVLAVRGTSQELLAVHADAIRRALASEDIRTKMQGAGFTPWFLAGEDFAQMIQKESETWQKLIVAKNLKAD
jgi:tripartite-type tricarboxylate transporter receptor subunit TctC